MGIVASGDIQAMEVFDAVDGSDTADIWTNYIVFSDHLSPWLLLVGCDGMGNQIALSLHPKELGIIHFYGRSEESPGSASGRDRGLFLIAASSTGILKALRPSERESSDSVEDEPDVAEILKRMLMPGLTRKERMALAARLTEMARKRR